MELLVFFEYFGTDTWFYKQKKASDLYTGFFLFIQFYLYKIFK